MKKFTHENLVVHPGNSTDPDVIVEVDPARVGWDTIHFQARRIGAGQKWSFETGEHELALVTLAGKLDVESNRGVWKDLGVRANVFAGLPTCLYLPRQTAFAVSGVNAAEYAVAWVPADQDFPARLIPPSEVSTEIRGGDNATRHINNMISPGFPCQRLVVVEVYTPGGNWSSYPPHKHDNHRTDPQGRLLEADLDEVYYYRIDRPEGYALQRVYTDSTSPLHLSGNPIDAALMLRDNDIALIPEGYHPVTSPPGYTTYYLNILAGSAQSLASYDDPEYSWVKDSYKSLDPRVPIYPVNRP